ncbi:MAG: phage tail sheath subtilisin-like domain-containing protein [Gammaproteobacteria bacterium]|nr:phage tail sheath subtilisin-like domain-containing protein [Gammaproteobacteria bacterium]
MSANQQFFHGVEVQEIDAGAKPIPVVTSSVIGLIGTAPDADAARFPLDTSVLLRGRLDAAGLALGTLDAIAVTDGGSGYTSATVAITGGGGSGATATAAIVGDAIDSITITNPGTGYTSAPTVTITGDGTGATATATLTETGTLPGATDGIYDQGGALVVVVRVADTGTEATTLTNLVGGVDAGTGAYEGVHAFLAAQGTVHVTPKILCAPGWTHQRPGDEANPVVAELLGIAERLRAVVVSDGPNTTDDDAIEYRTDWDSARIYVVDPWVRVWDAQTSAYVDEPPSARIAGLISKVDQAQGYWWSPSNHVINGIGGTSRPVDYQRGDANCRANVLNAAHVATIRHKDAGGYYLWGNRTATDDSDWWFLSVRRTADMIYESLQIGLDRYVDMPGTPLNAERLMESVRAFIHHQQAVGATLGGDVWMDPEINTPDQLALGIYTYDLDIRPPTPMEDIVLRPRLNNDYFTVAFRALISAGAVTEA